MRWNVELAESAARELAGLPAALRQRLRNRIETLAEDPLPQGVRKLRGYWDFYRFRVGDYRVLYHLSSADRLVRVLRIRHRREAYRGL